MRKIVYCMQMSIDGYIEDRDGRFDFTTPDPELHAFVNGMEISADTHVYGRRL